MASPADRADRINQVNRAIGRTALLTVIAVLLLRAARRIGACSFHKPIRQGLAAFAIKKFDDFALIDEKYELIRWGETVWDAFFSAVDTDPMTVVYEDFVRDYEATILRVLVYVGIDRPADLTLDAPRLAQQATSRNDEWAERFREMKRAQGEPVSES